VNQLTVEGQGHHILDDSEATYKDTLTLLPALFDIKLGGA
jgi:hypothetical protein